MKKYLFFNNIVLLLIFLSCFDREDVIIEKLEKKESIRHPSESPEEWLLAHLDIETTGLLPGYHEMIDIGIVFTNLDGNIIDSLFLRIQPKNSERLSIGAKAV